MLTHSKTHPRHNRTIFSYVTTATHLRNNFMMSVLSLILMTRLAAAGGASTPPKYLVPVNPNDRAYEQAIESLLNGRLGRGTMIYTESTYAGNDFVLSAWGKDRSEHDPDHPLNNFLTLIKVSPGQPGEAIRKAEIEIAIDPQLAMSIEKTWTTVLLKTRYPERPYLGLDGWQTEFSVFARRWGTLYGQLWSPSKGSTKELMDIGIALSKYVEAPDRERVPMRETLVRRLEDLTKKLQKDA